MLELKGKKTIILVTHQISFLWECDKVLIMEDGKIAHMDKPSRMRDILKKF